MGARPQSLGCPLKLGTPPQKSGATHHQMWGGGRGGMGRNGGSGDMRERGDVQPHSLGGTPHPHLNRDATPPQAPLPKSGHPQIGAPPSRVYRPPNWGGSSLSTMGSLGRGLPSGPPRIGVHPPPPFMGSLPPGPPPCLWGPSPPKPPSPNWGTPQSRLQGTKLGGVFPLHHVYGVPWEGSPTWTPSNWGSPPPPRVYGVPPSWTPPLFMGSLWAPK